MAGLAAAGLAGLLGLAGARGGAGAGGGAGAPGRVRLHLAPRDPGALHAHARAVQAGGRPAGGAAAREALRGLSAPREGAEARARAWAGALGGRVAAASPHGDFLDVELPRAAAEALSEGGAGQGRAVPGQALSAGKLPAPLAEDVLSARWVAVPRPAEGAAARGNDPRGRSQRALLQDDGDDGASSGNSTVAPSSVAALLLMGLNAAVPAGFLASKPREELLKNVKDLQSAPAIIVPCGVGVDPLTSGLTVQYHGTDGVECDFTVTASYEVWYGGAWEASEERTTPLTEFTQYRCGDLFADQSEEEAEASCRGWAQGITLALASQAGSIGGIAVQPAITADTSVFVYDLASNGLPTFAGVSGGRLAARVPDFDSARTSRSAICPSRTATRTSRCGKTSCSSSSARTEAGPTSASPWTTRTTLNLQRSSWLSPRHRHSPSSHPQSASAPPSPLSTQKPPTGVRTAQRPGSACRLCSSAPTTS